MNPNMDEPDIYEEFECLKGYLSLDGWKEFKKALAAHDTRLGVVPIIPIKSDQPGRPRS